MATGSLQHNKGLFETRRGRAILENITAYLFLAPAGTIIFLFGIFPVAFAFFVSLHQWRRFPGDYEGLDSYVEALGNFAYVGFFWIALGLFAYGLYNIVRLWRQTADDRIGLAYFIPGIAVAASMFAFVNWFFALLPFVLNVPIRMRGLEITRELFIEEFFLSFRFEPALNAADTMWLVFLVSAVIIAASFLFIKTTRNTYYLFLGMFAGLSFLFGFALISLTLTEIQTVLDDVRLFNDQLFSPNELLLEDLNFNAFSRVIETQYVPIWTYIVMISAGAGMIGVAYYLWTRAVKAYTNYAMLIRMLAAILLVVGAVVLIIQLPQALAEGDDDVFQGFNVTLMYAVFSVPLQLALGLGLAVLLFQNIRGKSFFRMIYFLPYITPFAATSVIFTLLFSHRSGSPANQLLTTIGIDTQVWLQSPRGIFQVIFGDAVPDQLAGPALALVVIILYNVWVYAGYSAVIFLAGLGGIPRELYEAAKIDGANGWQQFRFITFPLLSPTTFFLTLIATIGTFQAFTQIFLLRQPGAYNAVDTINIYIYDELRNSAPDYAYGSAMAFVLFGVILVLTLVQNRIAERRVFYG